MKIYVKFSTTVRIEKIKRGLRSSTVVLLLENGSRVELSAGDSLVVTGDSDFDGPPKPSTLPDGLIERWGRKFRRVQFRRVQRLDTGRLIVSPDVRVAPADPDEPMEGMATG